GRQAVSSVVVDPVTNRATFEHQLGIQRVLTGGFDLIRKISRPARIKAAGSSRTGVVTDLLLNARFANYRADLSKVEAQNVRIVDAGINGDRAGVLHMPPRGNRDAIAPGDVRFDHQPRFANRAA